MLEKEKVPLNNYVVAEQYFISSTFLDLVQKRISSQVSKYGQRSATTDFKLGKQFELAESIHAFRSKEKAIEGLILNMEELNILKEDKSIPRAIFLECRFRFQQLFLEDYKMKLDALCKEKSKLEKEARNKEFAKLDAEFSNYFERAKGYRREFYALCLFDEEINVTESCFIYFAESAFSVFRVSNEMGKKYFKALMKEKLDKLILLTSKIYLLKKNTATKEILELESVHKLLQCCGDKKFAKEASNLLGSAQSDLEEVEQVKQIVSSLLEFFKQKGNLKFPDLDKKGKILMKKKLRAKFRSFLQNGNYTEDKEKFLNIGLTYLEKKNILVNPEIFVTLE
eukprot:snap_masked-scaffold_5-processed-gene-4.10-mRNA-1 protein AED:1.00 eAED:1.00 QI:0/0/0/0/1/1/2/0/339